MRADERRVRELVDDPASEDIRESDIALVRAGLLTLTACHVGGKRHSIWLDAHPDAVRYLDKYGRINPARRKMLRASVKGKVRPTDIQLARTLIPNH